MLVEPVLPIVSAVVPEYCLYYYISLCVITFSTSNSTPPHLFSPPSGSPYPCCPGGQPRGQLSQPDPGGRAPSHPHLHRSQRRYGRPHHRCLPSSPPFCCLLIAPSAAVFVLFLNVVSLVLIPSPLMFRPLIAKRGREGGFEHGNAVVISDCLGEFLAAS